ncbi:MAG: tripartite tricarboxylate transporter substrate binding protein [Pseudomonadota bacterium]
MMRFFSAICFLALTAGTTSQAAAQAFPTRPIRLLVAYAPGGGTDILARTIAQAMAEDLGQPVVVENKPGANSQIATETVVKSPPDGYTLLMATSTHATNPSLNRKMSYDAVRDFAPVSLVATAPMVIVVSPTVPASNLKELIALAKQKPGTLNHATVTNSMPHLAGELFKKMAGIEFVAVGYPGGPAAYPDLISGRVQFMFDGLSSALPQIQTGKLKGIAVTNAKRAAAAPDIPTIAESGLPGFDAESVYGVVAPAGTPPAVIARLNASIRKAVAQPAVQERLKGLAYTIAVDTPAEYGAFIKAETAKWGAIIRDAGIKPE